MNTPGPDKVKALPISQVIDTLKFLHPDGAVFELCAINLKEPTSKLWKGRAYGKKPLAAGWFKDPAAAAKLAVQLEGEGVYITLNPCHDAMLARADHRLQAGVDRTADQHITGVKNLLIDIDPQRPTGVSSTDAEHDTALQMAKVIKAVLTNDGWPEPLVGDSGNGGHLDYALDLPNTQESIDLVKGVLGALALRHQEQLARLNLEIDQMVFNPGRLVKLYGTWVRKGDNTPDRPHRLSRIISLPEIRRPVPVDLLKKLVATTAAAGASQARPPGPDQGRLDLKAYLAYYQVEVVKVKPHAGGQLFCLAACVFNSDHTENEAAIFQAADGVLSYKCFHDSCQGRTWSEARASISGQDKLNEFIVCGGSRTAPTPKPPAPARLKIDASRPQPRPLEIRFVSGAELQKIEFQDPQWIIDNTLPEGLCLLSARPKKGKTWMAMGFATAVVTGGCALGKGELRVPKGKVLYLCLEDRMRRFKKRLKQILQDLPFPEELIIADTWPRLDKGGLEALQDFLKEHDDCRLVVIDSFAKIRPSRSKNVDPYEFDMAMGGALQNLAQQHQICLLIIYHNRKTESEDPLDDVIGSTGLTGAVDAVLVLRRGRGKSDGTLFISGRDVEEQELALRFHPKEGLWEFLGDAAEYAKSQQRQEIIAHLRGSEPQTPKEIAKALDKPYEITKKTLHRMARDGELKSLEGKYELLLLK